MEDAKQKSHRRKQAGPKADRKKQRTQSTSGDGKPQNTKAFTFKSTVRAARSVRRTLDVQTKKLHLPVVDRTPLEPPPIVVAVVGPPKVGKSTLISSLVKNYSRQTLTDVKGPVTVVSGGETEGVPADLLCSSRVECLPFRVRRANSC